MCETVLEVDPSQLCDTTDYLKTQKMCDDEVRRDPYSLQFVPDWFATQEQRELWDDNDDRLIN